MQYCAFRATNTELKRRTLNQEEIAEETRTLIRQGHKRVLMVSGEGLPEEGFQYILDSISTIYKTKVGPGEIRRVNVNLAPQTTERFRQLKDAEIGTFQLFQETYHRPTYAEVHLKGAKRDYDWRTTAFDRAMEAGIDDVGIGVLFGLYDWRFEMHGDDAAHPASGREVWSWSAYDQLSTYGACSWLRFRITASACGERCRLSEDDCDHAAGGSVHGDDHVDARDGATCGAQRLSWASLRFRRGAAPIRADTRTAEGDPNGRQFQLGDHRTVEEVVNDVVSLGFLPSFCTACYRTGRTGHDFMDLAKPGEIKYHCHPNALSTFQEYLCDYAKPGTKTAGERSDFD